MTQDAGKFLLNPIPKEITDDFKEVKIYLLFLSPHLFTVSKGLSLGEGLWELTYNDYQNCFLVLTQKVMSAQFLTVIKNGDKEYCSNTFLKDGVFISSPFLNVKSEIKNKEITTNIKIFGNKDLRNHLLIEGIREDVELEGCSYIHDDCGKEMNIGSSKEFKMRFEKEEDFILTFTVIFSNGTQTSFPYKYNIMKSHKGLKNILQTIYDFTLKDDESKFLTYVKIKNIPTKLCLNKGVHVNHDILLKPNELKDIEITSFDEKLSEVNLELEYNLLEDGKIKSEIKTFKINLSKTDSVFSGSQCINCEKKGTCEIFDILKYEYPYSPYLKYTE